MSRILTDTATITQDVGTAGVLKLNIPTNAPIVASSLALGGATIGSNALAVTGTALFNSQVQSGLSYAVGAPQYSSQAVSTTGFSVTANGVYFSRSGVSIAAVSSAGLSISSGYGLGFGSGAADTFSPDTFLYRDAANTVALVNGTSPQVYRVYNTSTSSNANYERLTIGFDGANTAVIGTENAGTGVARNLKVVIGGVNKLDYGVTTGAYWTFVGGIIGGSHIYCGAGYTLSWNGRASMYSPSDGVIEFTNTAVTDFNRLQFGGTTNLFPSLKRSTTYLQARLADDSDYCFIQGKHATHTSYTAGTFTATGYLTLYDSGGTAYRVPCAV